MTSKTHPANKIANVKRRAIRASHLGTTCPASRQVLSLAETIMARGLDLRDYYDTEQIASAILSVVESLWKERAKGATRKVT